MATGHYEKGNLLVTPHFKLGMLFWSDTALKHNIVNTPTDLDVIRNLKILATVLEQFWWLVDDITSGYRSPKLNKLVGGVPNSRHVQGLAIDFKPPTTYGIGEAVSAIAALEIEAIEDIIPYDNHIHIELKETVS